LVYCIASLFYYVFVLSPAPMWYIIVLLWRDMAYLCRKCRYTPSNKQTLLTHSLVSVNCSRCYGRMTWGSTCSVFKTCFRSICWWSRSWVLSALASATSTSVLSRTWSHCSPRLSCCRSDWSHSTRTMKSRYSCQSLCSNPVRHFLGKYCANIRATRTIFG